MLNQLNAQLRRELAQIETENIDSIINSHFEAEKLKTYLFDSLQNLKTIEDWLVTYSRQLDAMGADVHLVERRNKALQNESDQQKLLLSEIEGLIADLKLPGYVLEVLKNEPLEFAEGIKLCEEATERLMDSISNKFQAVEIADMKAVKERIVLFQSYANDFAERLSLFLQNLFKSQSDAYLFDVDRLCKRGNLKLYGHEAFEEKIYKFKKLLLWLKSVDARKHNELQIKYTQEIGRVYKHEIHELFEQLRQHHVQKIHAADQSYRIFKKLI